MSKKRKVIFREVASSRDFYHLSPGDKRRLESRPFLGDGLPSGAYAKYENDVHALNEVSGEAVPREVERPSSSGEVSSSWLSVCEICGNEASSEEECCDHLRPLNVERPSSGGEAVFGPAAALNALNGIWCVPSSPKAGDVWYENVSDGGVVMCCCDGECTHRMPLGHSSTE